MKNHEPSGVCSESIIKKNKPCLSPEKDMITVITSTLLTNSKNKQISKTKPTQLSAESKWIKKSPNCFLLRYI